MTTWLTYCFKYKKIKPISISTTYFHTPLCQSKPNCLPLPRFLFSCSSSRNAAQVTLGENTKIDFRLGDALLATHHNKKAACLQAALRIMAWLIVDWHHQNIHGRFVHQRS